MEKTKNSVDKKVFIKDTIKLGNSAGVLLPKALLGSKVKVIILNKPVNLLDIKKDALKILENYLSVLSGIYVTNIPKQNQKKIEKIELLAISTSLKKTIQTEKYKINIVPLKLIKKDLQDLKTQQRLKHKLSQAKIILNQDLLFKLIPNS